MTLPGAVLQLRRRADKSGGVESLIDNPNGSFHIPGDPVPKSWPLASVEFVGAPPNKTSVSMDYVANGVHEGWITGTGRKEVHRPGGRVGFEWSTTHTFTHYSTLTVCGVKYKVTHQPDKYASDGDDNTLVTNENYAEGRTRVDWFYEIELAA